MFGVVFVLQSCHVPCVWIIVFVLVLNKVILLPITVPQKQGCIVRRKAMYAFMMHYIRASRELL